MAETTERNPESDPHFPESIARQAKDTGRPSDPYGSGGALDIQMKKGVLGLCVLAVLARGESYAYEIASRLSDAIGMGEGTIYPLMRRMQTDGLVETYLVESPAGPPRKYYRLTLAGHQALEAQRSEWSGFVRAVEALIDTRSNTLVVQEG